MVQDGRSPQHVVMGDRRAGATSRRVDSSDLVAVEQVESPLVDDTWPPAFLVATMAPVDVMAPSEEKGIDRFTRVLLVDDEEDEFVLARDLLRRAGDGRFSLEWARTFDAGLDLLSINMADVCLVDYRLGAETGLDFIREAQSVSAVPLILMTGRGDRGIDAALRQELRVMPPLHEHLHRRVEVAQEFRRGNGKQESRRARRRTYRRGFLLGSPLPGAAAPACAASPPR